MAPPRQASVGASGAIFGLFGAYFVIARARRVDSGPIVGLIVVNLLLGFTNPIIDNRAHIGGLITGAIVALGFQLAERLPKTAAIVVEVATVTAVAALIAGLTAMRTGTLTT